MAQLTDRKAGRRRNYGSVFRGILESRELMNDTNFQLNLIGMGDIFIPPELAGKVAMHTKLPYRVRGLKVWSPKKPPKKTKKNP